MMEILYKTVGIITRVVVFILVTKIFTVAVGAYHFDTAGSLIVGAVLVYLYLWVVFYAVLCRGRKT